MDPYQNPITPLQYIALVSDIHGNLPALQSVYEHARQQGALLFFNAGDTIGYGPFPNECIDFIREKKFFSVIGDYDQKVLAFPQHAKEYRQNKHPLKNLAFQWAFENLTQPNIQYLSQLPVNHQMTIAHKSFFLTHGTPNNTQAHIGNATTSQEWQRYQQEAHSDIVISGNTHIYHHHTALNTLFVNPGSVGRQDDGDPRASYAILQLDDPFTIRQYRVEYDIEHVIKQLEFYDLPCEFSYMFREGCSLNTALLQMSSYE